MTTEMKVAIARDAGIQLGTKTYQQSMQDLSAVVAATPSENGVVILQPGQLSVVQVQVGKQYKIRKSANTNQSADNLVAVRHGDALHVRYADGSAVHFENFYSVCTDESACSVNLASDGTAGTTLTADNVNAGVAADDGLLVYAHGDSDVLMSMAQDQSELSGALKSVDDGPKLTYLSPSPYLGLGLIGLAAIGGLASKSSNTSDGLNGDTTNAGQVRALNTISAAAEKNTAASSKLAASTYSDAGVTGVDASNVDAINSALDTANITGAKADTAPELQAIVNAYNAILASADGKAGNTATAITGEQYAAIGVSGVPIGSPTEGSVLKLLDETVDKSSASGVNTAAKIQAMADAAAHVMSAAGGSATDANNLSVADLQALGFTDVTADNIAAIRAAIQATKPDSAIDQQIELAKVVNDTLAAAANALIKISNAAGANNASGGGSVAALATDDYATAGVTGVTASNVAAINKALDSVPVTADKADTAAEVQAIVNAYAAILASADGVAGNTATPITGEQYAAIGVTGVPTGSPADGSVLKLLDETVDKSATSAVSTVAQLQAMAEAAARVLTAAGGQSTDANNLSVSDLQALGFTNVTTDNIIAVRKAIQNTIPDSAIDQQSELTAVVNNAIAGIATELDKISKAAGANNASGAAGVAALNLDDYSKANVSGVSSSNVAAINSALDTAAVTADLANTTPEVQAIVDAYNAIEASANSKAGDTSPALTGAQYNAIGVTGINAVASEGTALYLLNNVVDQSAVAAVDTAPEVQALANAAAHVISAAAGGTDLTAKELVLLGITGVTEANFLAVRTAIAATLDNGIEVDTRLELQAVTDKVTHVSSMSLQTTLGGTTNLEVTSDLVFTADRAVTAGKGLIHIKDVGGSGFHGDTYTNNQDIDISTAIDQHLVSIVNSGTSSATIIINPKWDLDLSSNYQISFDAGVFVDSQGHGSAAMSPVSFSTVTPGHSSNTKVSDAVASKAMSDTDGSLVAGKLWLDIEGIGNVTGTMAQLGDLSNGAYALAMKNYSEKPGGDGVGGNHSDGIVAHDSNVGVLNFGANDIVYFDAQLNDSTKQLFDGHFTSVLDGSKFAGGAEGQSVLILGAAYGEKGGTVNVGLGLEGNTDNTPYGAVYSVGSGATFTQGWADLYHSATPPMIMG